MADDPRDLLQKSPTGLPADRSRWDRIEDPDATGPGAGLPGANTTGGVIGDENTTGSVITHEREHDFRAEFPAENDDNVTADPVHEGTVYMDTSARGRFADQDSEPDGAADDLGPEGAIIQEVGGEARY
jgi:hypothetical protein